MKRRLILALRRSAGCCEGAEGRADCEARPTAETGLAAHGGLARPRVAVLLAFCGLLLVLAPASRAQQVVDRIVARVRNEVITQSDLNELGRFQKLVDGKEQAESERVRELAEQWIVEQEATLTGFEAPSPAEAEKAFAALEKRIGSPAAFQAKLKQAGLTEGEVKRMLARQIFLSRFLEYRFRPEVQVSERAIETYYEKTLVPELQRARSAVPPLASVSDKIRALLVERGISERAKAWLEEMRARWKVEMIGGKPSS